MGEVQDNIIDININNIKHSDFVVMPFNKGKEAPESILIYRCKFNDGREEAIVIGKVDMEAFKKVDRLDETYRYRFRIWIPYLNNLLDEYKKYPLLESDDLKDKLYKKPPAINSRDQIVSYKNLFETGFFKKIYFTQEGYDFLNGKNIFSNNIIERTVGLRKISTQKDLLEDNNIMYSNEYFMLSNSDECFKNYNYFEEEYTLTETERKTLTYNQVLGFVYMNFDKIDLMYKTFIMKVSPGIAKKIIEDYQYLHIVSKLGFLVSFIEALSEIKIVESKKR